jgi:N-acyl-D-aspartate/D-glutamate deacylase
MRRMMRAVGAVLCVICGAALAGLVQAQPSFDVLIRNGRVLDGSGNPGNVRTSASGAIALPPSAGWTPKRPHVSSMRVMSYVLVNGVVVIDDGRFTETLPGRVLRK